MANIRTQTKRRYGLDWPADVDDTFVELTLSKKWMLPPYCHGNLLDPGEHMLRAIRKLEVQDVFAINPWSEAMVHCWCSEDFMVWLGAASSGKSHATGCLAVLDWVTDPTKTYIALASTSVPMLKLRSFNSVLEMFRALKKHPRFLIPGKEAPSQTAIVNDADDVNDATIKASIRGVALAEGNEARAVARLAGAHIDFVTNILDEGSALPEAAARARFNASAGTKRFRFVSLANPVDFQDEATRFCEPVELPDPEDPKKLVPADGWSSVDKDSGYWRSRYGAVMHFNAEHSPAVTEPDGAEKYPYLINSKQIERMVNDAHGNVNDPMIWRMVYGFPAPVGLENTVLSWADVQTFHMQAQPVWDARDVANIQVAGLDPAFTSGGDSCVLQRATIGYTREGLQTVSFAEPDYLALDASSGRPIAFQIVDQLRQLLARHGIPVSNVAIDDSGTQSVADIVVVEIGGHPIRCIFNGKASDDPLGSSGEPANKRFRNQVTEIWFLLAELGRRNQLRNLGAKAAAQFCQRQFRKGQTPLALETKEDYKKRTGQRSPDEGDASALCCMAARRIAKVIPGSERAPSHMFRSGFTGGRVTIVGRNPSANYNFPVDMDRLSAYSSGNHRQGVTKGDTRWMSRMPRSNLFR